MLSIEELRRNYNSYAAANDFSGQNPQELYQPLDYILALGGKQMRPLLLLMAAALFEEKSVEKAMPAAYAVELFHNFSLIHDDIMDEAAVRRGKPTVHIKFGNSTAILSGDVMLVKAYQFLTETATDKLPVLIRIFNETAIGVCEGQQMDMNFESLSTVKLEEYIRMIELKTSILLHGAMKMGAIIAGASDNDAEYTAEFGRTMGIAFQLQDDFLDSFGDEATFGKRIGGDIVQNKKTFLFLKAMELGNDVEKEILTHWYTTAVNATQEEEKIVAVKSIFFSSGAVKAIEIEIEKYRLMAEAAMNKVSATEKKKSSMLAFLNYIMQRKN
jgi:geranylgeranyl diphosphate synthase type II